MDTGRLVIRCLFGFCYLLIVFRLSGKRTVAEVTPFELVMALIMGDLVDDLVWDDVPATQFAVAVAALWLANFTAAFAGSRSDFFFNLINGRVTTAMRQGVVQHQELATEQLNEADIEHLLRGQGLPRERWPEARVAFVERDHEVSVLHEQWAKSATRKDFESSVHGA